MIKKDFDPEGSSYDYLSAYWSGASPEDGHWPSRDPLTGRLLKGRQHPTWNLLEQGEEEAGYEIYKGEDGKYYSRPKYDLDLMRMLYYLIMEK